MELELELELELEAAAALEGATGVVAVGFGVVMGSGIFD
jgi:hypothetical protein